MVCHNCRKKLQATLPEGVRVASLKNGLDDPPEAIFEIKYVGTSAGMVAYRGPSGHKYRFAAGDAAVQGPRCDAEFFNGLVFAFRVSPASAG